MGAQLDGDVRAVLDVLAVPVRRVEPVGDGHGTVHNANWHVWPTRGPRCVLRRYHVRASADELAYEHAVIRHLAQAGWTVPVPVSDPVRWAGRWFCLTAFVPGRARPHETSAQRRQRGADLARLQLALRPLGEGLGQRPRWRAQHQGTTVHTDIDWSLVLAAVADEAPRLAGWAEAAADASSAELHAIGAERLPSTIVHGDFHEANVHYDGDRLAGVIDFGLSHLDTRPYELAIARTYRAPEARDAYRGELVRVGWPLSELEEAAIGPVYRAFRVDMVAWQLAEGTRTGRFDTEAIVRQLARTGVAPP